MAGETLRRTPLYEEHKKEGAKLVDFAGWEMPVQYEGIRAEHEAVRERAGLFDVSHMGEVAFKGPQAEDAVQRLVTRDVSRLSVGQAGYAAVCYEDGGTVDDVLVYRNPDDFLIVVNAANKDKDVAHFRENTRDLDVEIEDQSDDWALLALQGPEATGILQEFTGTDLSGIRYYRYEVGEVDGGLRGALPHWIYRRGRLRAVPAPGRRPRRVAAARGVRGCARGSRGSRHAAAGGRDVPLR